MQRLREQARSFATFRPVLYYQDELFEHTTQFRINISDPKISGFEAERVSLNYQLVGALNMEKQR